MPKTKAIIKTITAPSQPCFAAYLPDEENDIESKIVPIVCWSLMSFDKKPDEVIGQIICNDLIVEVTYVDEEEGFGNFLGYFDSEKLAEEAILSAMADEGEGEDEEEDGEGEGEEEEEEEEEGEDDEDEEDDDEEEGDEEGDDDDGFE